MIAGITRAEGRTDCKVWPCAGGGLDMGWLRLSGVGLNKTGRRDAGGTF